MKLRVITLFSGYDSQCLALERLKRDYPEFDYELKAWCEIDANAIKAHNALFPQHKDLNFGDICAVDVADIPDCDLITYSFPCTSISNAGKQEGLEQGSGTASSLVWECFKIFEAKRPKYLLMENVKALTQKKFLPYFKEIQKNLERLGYTNYWQVMNAKDYGVAQNRERVFMVSVLSPETPFVFPEVFPLDKAVEEYMEEAEDVSEEYYIDESRVTEQVLLDLLKQPNVRTQLELMYHEEWQSKLQ